MFSVKYTHFCTLPEQGDKKEKLGKKSVFQRFRNWWLDQISLSEAHPACLEYFRSESEALQEKKKQLESGLLCIHPFSTFRTYYSIYVSQLYLFSVITVPFCGAFPRILDTPLVFAYSTTLNFLCLINLIMQFFMGYTNKNKKTIEMDPAIIAKHYFFSPHFVCDFFSSLPQPPYPAYEDSSLIPWFVSGLCLLKCFRIPTIIRYISYAAEYYGINDYATKLFQVVFQTVLVLHFFTCLTYLHSLIEYKFNLIQGCWVEKIYDKSLFTNYVQGLFRASSYVYAIEVEVLPKDQVGEHYMACFLYIAGKLFTLYNIVVILNLYGQRHALEVKYLSIMSQVDCYMKTKKIKPHMRKKIIAFYQYKFNNKYFKEHNRNTFFSEQLRNEINSSIYIKLLREVHILNELPKDALEQILSNLKTEIFLPRDIIIRAGTSADCMFFLANGTVAVYSPTGSEICHLQDGAYFGEISLLCDVSRTATVIAIEICKVYILRGSVFKKCFQTNPELYRNLKLAAQRTAERTENIDIVYKSRQGIVESCSAMPRVISSIYSEPRASVMQK